MNINQYKIFLKKRNGIAITKEIFSYNTFENITIEIENLILKYNKENPKSYLKEFKHINKHISYSLYKKLKGFKC